jgi:hypothetical protein
VRELLVTISAGCVVGWRGQRTVRHVVRGARMHARWTDASASHACRACKCVAGGSEPLHPARFGDSAAVADVSPSCVRHADSGAVRQLWCVVSIACCASPGPCYAHNGVRMWLAQGRLGWLACRACAVRGGAGRMPMRACTERASGTRVRGGELSCKARLCLCDTCDTCARGRGLRCVSSSCRVVEVGN